MGKIARGYTLVEVLIASVLLFLVLLTGVWAYTFFASNLDKASNQNNAKIDQLRDSIVARYVIEAIMPYYVPAGTADRRGVPFFNGTRDGFFAISEYSLSDAFLPSVIRVSFDPEAQHIALCSQTPAAGFVRSAPQEVKCEQSLILLNRVKDVAFDYYGWDSIDDYFLMRNDDALVQPKLGWRSTYVAQRTEIMPFKVRMTAEDLNGKKLALVFDLNGRDDSRTFHHRSGSNVF